MNADALDHRFLREFLTVAQEGSIRRAAEKLNIVPSAISRKLADAEARLGVQLFERSSTGMQLTDAGRLVLDHANHLREEQDYVLDLLGQYRNETRRVVRLGVGEGFAADLMQNGLRHLMADYPGLSYDIRMAGTDALLRMVADGQVDISLAYNPILVPGTRALAIGQQPLCAIVPVTSPLIGRSDVTLLELLDQPMMILNAAHGIRQLVARAAADQGQSLHPVAETDSVLMLIRFVTAGLGITFLPRFAATIQAERGELAIIPIREPLFHSASAHAIVRARRRLPSSVDAVATILARNMVAFQG
ncbi:LysR family transcriptional regulator [Paracoccaceae bacterium GXU_MW_L88]